MLICPAINAIHTPLLRRLVAFSRIGDALYVYWRVPLPVGRRIALARRVWLTRGSG